ncbi:RNA polymerase sigma factor [Symmachiella dynata]|uniref:sigma factor n=1 Tax=Symmachiella dynata TaxID=2527995 RepID=UPI0011899986|nr:sigma factor [Symmachiella dynata]QDT49000.1 RNA polymerase sigma factor [Symmachiella dynata]
MVQQIKEQAFCMSDPTVHDATPEQLDEDFCQKLASVQNILLSYVISLVRDVDTARDITQETNLALWRKRRSYSPAESFNSWALRFAHLQTLAALKTRRRDRLAFDQELMGQLASEAADVYGDLEDRVLKLRECLSRLPRHQHDIVLLRYHDESQLTAEVSPGANTIDFDLTSS